ncbi:hypothetical protein EDB19DRAFT_1914420 [Suillus lakei]|nr:hypothetical protein EDB19DRAFT_1914420 [Suillus lakei]
MSHTQNSMYHYLQPFNLGFGLPPRSTLAQEEPPAGQVLQPFNLGFDLPPCSTPPQREPPAGPVLQPCNLGFQLSSPSTPPQAEVPASPIPKPFNLGFNLNIPINQPQVVVPAVQTGDRHVGYTATNRHKFDSHVLINSDPPAAFQFNSLVALPARRPQQPTLASLIGDAKQVVINIFRHLNGDEYPHSSLLEHFGSKMLDHVGTFGFGDIGLDVGVESDISTGLYPPYFYIAFITIHSAIKLSITSITSMNEEALDLLAAEEVEELEKEELDIDIDM